MADYGAKFADKEVARTQKQLREIYETAQAELRVKLADFEARHAVKDKKQREKLHAGLLSMEEYQNWMRGQVFIRGQWQGKIHEVSEVLNHCNEEAARIIHENKIGVFTENYNFNAYLGEQRTGISFDVYNTQAVAKLIKEQPQILPEWKIDQPKDYQWNYKKVNNIVNQGIIQGESVDDIGERLCRDLTTQNENKMRMFARTAITGAQNAGRQQQMRDASELGIKQNKQWLATFDSRTRDVHRQLDGQEVPYDEPFQSALGEINYPGDPEAEPANVYNCRCTIVTIYPDYENRNKSDWREELDIDGMEYDGWKGEEAYQHWKEQKETLKREKEEQEKAARKKAEEERKEKPKAEKKKRTPEPFDIDNATDIDTITKQMVSEKMVKSANLKGLDLETTKDIYRTYQRMIETFPMMKGKLGSLRLTNKDSKTYADCVMVNGNIELNSVYYNNVPALNKAYRKDVLANFHPFGTDYHAVLYHELGHALDGILAKEYFGSGTFSEQLLETVLNRDEMFDWKPFKEEEIAAVSRYASKNEKEWFAESIAIMMTAEEKHKGRMQKVFENQLFGFIEE